MDSVVSADDLFTVRGIGNALGRLYHIDGSTLRLSPALDAEGDQAACPITLAPISYNAGMIYDGTIYQMGYIMNWLEDNNRSPLTNLGRPPGRLKGRVWGGGAPPVKKK